jgi:hypothetical protein
MNTNEHELKKPGTFQQGDVIGRRLDQMPEASGAVIGRKRLVLAHGESGHSHVIEEEEAELLRIGDRMILNLTRQATLKHEEHKPITLEPGIWEIGRVREFDWFAMMGRQVCD